MPPLELEIFEIRSSGPVADHIDDVRGRALTQKGCKCLGHPEISEYIGRKLQLDSFRRAAADGRRDRRIIEQRDARNVTAVLKIFLRVVEQVLREQSPGAAPKARLAAVSFVHRFARTAPS
jgi:hypothetical protein